MVIMVLIIFFFLFWFFSLFYYDFDVYIQFNFNGFMNKLNNIQQIYGSKDRRTLWFLGID